MRKSKRARKAEKSKDKETGKETKGGRKHLLNTVDFQTGNVGGFLKLLLAVSIYHSCACSFYASVIATNLFSL